MTCTNSLPLSDDDLLEILIGDADPTLVDCLDADENSKRRYQALVKFHRKLQRAFHPSDQTLVDYVNELLSDEHHEAVSEHVDECYLCRETVRALMQQAIGEDSVQPIVIATPRREYTARIVPTAAQGLAYFGGEQIAAPRMVQAEAEGVTIMLRIMSEGRGVRLMGTIDATDPSQQERWNGAQLQLSQGDDIIMTTLLRYGEFQCSAVPRSKVTLRFKPLAGRVVALYDLPLE
ncbi:MAG: hypothetical protein SNJ58_04870 [Aggregatilineales bacterium]